MLVPFCCHAGLFTQTLNSNSIDITEANGKTVWMHSFNSTRLNGQTKYYIEFYSTKSRCEVAQEDTLKDPPFQGYAGSCMEVKY